MNKIIVLGIIIVINMIYFKRLINIVIDRISVNISTNRVNYSNELLKSINLTIQGEIVNKVKMSYMLGEKHTVRDFDDDIEEISNKVFRAYKKEIFLSGSSIYTPTYLCSYILSQTTLIYFEYTTTSEED